MEQQAVTCACAALLLLAVALSRVRARRGPDGALPHGDTVRSLVEEAREALGAERTPGADAARALDLAPLALAASLLRRDGGRPADKDPGAGCRR